VLGEIKALFNPQTCPLSSQDTREEDNTSIRFWKKVNTNLKVTLKNFWGQQRKKQPILILPKANENHITYPLEKLRMGIKSRKILKGLN
jgi:hypothetical protein